jgi:PAS domain S-box-containing protein
MEKSKYSSESFKNFFSVKDDPLNNEMLPAVEARNYADSIIATIREPLLVLDKDLRIRTANQSFYETFKVTEHETQNQFLYELGNRQWNIPELIALLKSILPEKTTFSDYEIKHTFDHIGERIMSLNAREIKDNSYEERLILLAIQDITEQKEAEKVRLLLSSIIESSDDAIVSKTLDGIITSWNKGAERIFGFTEAEAVGKHITLIIPPDLYADEEMIISKIKKGEKVFHFNTIRLAKNGRKMYVSLTISPIKDKSGKVIGASKIARDITELKEKEQKLRESENRYSQLLQNLPVAVYTTNTNGLITYYNKAAAELWGRKPVLGVDQWCGSFKIFTMDGTPVPLCACPMAQVLKGGQYEPGEAYMIERPDGTYRYMIPSPTTIFDLSGNYSGAINTLVDVTGQVKAKLESEQIQQQKDDFLGIASHELKTPITVIKSYSQILESMLREKGNDREAAMSAKMSQQVDKINNLIIDLLDTTKINAGQLQFNYSTFDFHEMVTEVLEDMKSTTKSHRMIVESGASCKVYFDKERVAQVVENFITNAVKYSPGSDKIIIRTELIEDQIIFSVQDFGIGIDADKKDRVFEQFYRVVAKGEPNTYPGIGLGLYISAQIIKRENGKIWVESEKGKGSVFYFSLPNKLLSGKSNNHHSAITNASKKPVYSTSHN